MSGLKSRMEGMEKRISKPKHRKIEITLSEHVG